MRVMILMSILLVSLFAFKPGGSFHSNNHKSISSLKLSKALSTNEASHDITVGGSSQSIIINVQMNPMGNVKLIRPDGIEALSSDDDISITKTNVNQTTIVTSPVAGIWRVVIVGDSGVEYSLHVDSVSDVRIVSFDFVELKGRLGHEGYFPIDGHPLSTVKQHIVLSMAGGVNNASMQLLALDGTNLMDVALEEVGTSSIKTSYIATTYLPSEPFKVVVVGEDLTGEKFQRDYGQTYVPQSVSVKPVIDKFLVLLQPNRESELIFSVTNTGPSDTFMLSATKEDNSQITLDTPEIVLSSGETKEVVVRFVAPENMSQRDGYNVTLNAQSKSSKNSSNYAIYTAKVSSADSDGDGVSDEMEKHIYDGNDDGIADHNQNSVASLLGAFGAGFTFALESGDFRDVKVSRVSDELRASVDGNISFGVFDFKVSKPTTLKVFYAQNIHPTEYHKYDSSTNSYEKDESVVFEKGYSTMQLDSTSNKGFFVFNNKSPRAYVPKQETLKNKPITIDLLENSFDEDGDTIYIVQVDANSNQGGSIVKSDGSSSKVVYTPKSDFKGEDYFSYVITDKKGGFYKIDVQIGVGSLAL